MTGDAFAHLAAIGIIVALLTWELRRNRRGPGAFRPERRPPVEP